MHESVDSGGWPPPRGGFPVPGGPGQLYNLVDDPREQHNLFEEQPEVVAEMTAELLRIQDAGRSTPQRS